MTVHQNVEIAIINIVDGYSFYDRRFKTHNYEYWEVIKMIQNAYLKMNAINETLAKQLCNAMNCTFEEMLTA